MTFVAAESLPDSASFADEHFLLDQGHYHALSRAGFVRTGLRELPKYKGTPNLLSGYPMIISLFR